MSDYWISDRVPCFQHKYNLCMCNSLVKSFKTARLSFYFIVKHLTNLWNQLSNDQSVSHLPQKTNFTFSASNFQFISTLSNAFCSKYIIWKHNHAHQVVSHFIDIRQCSNAHFNTCNSKNTSDTFIIVRMQTKWKILCCFILGLSH